jgi:sugar fermentation stimulation protein A
MYNTLLYKYDNLEEFIIVKRTSRLSVLVSGKNGKEYLAHLTNTGRLRELIYPKSVCLCVPKKSGKTYIRLIGIKINNNDEVLIDPLEQSMAFQIAIKKRLIPWLKDWHIKKSEVYVGDSRLDYEIESKDGKQGYVEVKSAALLLDNKIGSFPDCPSERGQKHVILLRKITKKNIRAIMAFIVTHPSAQTFSPNSEGDEKFVKLLKEAVKDGLEIRAIKILLKTTGEVVLVDSNLPCVIN